MKLLIKVFLFSFAFILFSCDKEDNITLKPDASIENDVDPKKVTYQNDKASCSKDCPVGSCEASGATVTCKCVLGLFAKCVASSTQMPTQDGDQSNESGNLVNFIDDNLTPSSVATNLSSTVNSIQNAIDSGDDVAYENGLSDFEIQMNNLSISNKEAMNDYAESINIDPIFEL